MLDNWRAHAARATAGAYMLRMPTMNQYSEIPIAFLTYISK